MLPPPPPLQPTRNGCSNLSGICFCNDFYIACTLTNWWRYFTSHKKRDAIHQMQKKTTRDSNPCTRHMVSTNIDTLRWNQTFITAHVKNICADTRINMPDV